MLKVAVSPRRSNRSYSLGRAAHFTSLPHNSSKATHYFQPPKHPAISSTTHPPHIPTHLASHPNHTPHNTPQNTPNHTPHHTPNHTPHHTPNHTPNHTQITPHITPQITPNSTPPLLTTRFLGLHYPTPHLVRLPRI